MTVENVLADLESLKDERVYERNKKNGAGTNQFGVKLGEIRKFAKQIKTDHALGLELWETKNLEVRLLSILIMVPKKLSAEALEYMTRSLETPQVADWFNSYVLKNHPEKEELRKRWINSDHIWVARSGWSLTAQYISNSSAEMNVSDLLDRIESELLLVEPEVQWTMNMALAQAGIRFPQYRERAVAIGEKLGLYKDFPVSKGCTSPFAPIWIREMVSRQS